MGWHVKHTIGDVILGRYDTNHDGDDGNATADDDTSMLIIMTSKKMPLWW